MSHRVLVVDDDRSVRTSTARALELEGYEVEVAVDGLQGLDTLASAGAELIVLDVMMPKRSGFEVLEQIKKNSQYKDVPVVMLSNLAGKEDADRAIQMGAAEYLIKSQYQPKEIVEKVVEIIRTRAAQAPSA